MIPLQTMMFGILQYFLVRSVGLKKNTGFYHQWYLLNIFFQSYTLNDFFIQYHYISPQLSKLEIYKLFHKEIAKLVIFHQKNSKLEGWGLIWQYLVTKSLGVQDWKKIRDFTTSGIYSIFFFNPTLKMNFHESIFSCSLAYCWIIFLILDCKSCMAVKKYWKISLVVMVSLVKY